MGSGWGLLPRRHVLPPPSPTHRTNQPPRRLPAPTHTPNPTHPHTHTPKQTQILLFSATFNERVKRFAQKIVPDANQVSAGCVCGWVRRRGQALGERAGRGSGGGEPATVRTRLSPPPHLPMPHTPCQVFIPKEELSLDVIKQYRVVRGTPGTMCGTMHATAYVRRRDARSCAQRLRARARIGAACPPAPAPPPHLSAPARLPCSCLLCPCRVLQYCPQGSDKVRVLKDMIFPLVSGGEAVRRRRRAGVVPACSRGLACLAAAPRRRGRPCPAHPPPPHTHSLPPLPHPPHPTRSARGWGRPSFSCAPATPRAPCTPL